MKPPARPLAAVLVVAGSLAAAPAPPAAAPPVTVTVVELTTGRPIAGATVVLMNSTASGFNKVYATTGPDGSAQATPKDADRSSVLQLVVQDNGFVPVRENVFPARLAAAGHPLRLVMEHATPISGSVVDQDGKPLAGAIVMFGGLKRYPDGLEMLDVLQRTATTGVDGRWTYDGMPADATQVQLALFSPVCLGPDPAVHFVPVPDLAPLHEGSLKVRVTRGVPIDVTVHGPDGRPVRAKLVYGPVLVSIAVRPVIETDADGHVRLGVPPNTTAVLTVTANGFAPDLQRVTVGTAAAGVTFELRPAVTLTGRVVDTAGKGVAGADVVLQSWRDARTLRLANIGVVTATDGSFAWTGAPTDDVTLTVSAPGFRRATAVPARVGQPVNIILSSPTQPAAGGAID